MKQSMLSAAISIRERLFLARHGDAPVGSADWLAATEIKYGGMVRDIPRRKVSKSDRREPEQLRRGGMIGGDRMLHNRYREAYAEHLLPYLHRQEPVTIAEIGILAGTGLAIWCDLFPKGRVIGLDIDLSIFDRNRDFLLKRGAFQRSAPELHAFDQFEDNLLYVREILNGDEVDICIDDGVHVPEAILTTLDSVMPVLAERFVYFVEDEPTVHEEIGKRYPHLCVESRGALTVITRER